MQAALASWSLLVAWTFAWQHWVALLHVGPPVAVFVVVAFEAVCIVDLTLLVAVNGTDSAINEKMTCYS